MPEFWPLIMAVALMSSWLTADILIPWVVRFAHRIGNVDKPDARKVHKEPIARLGGIAIFAGFLASLAALEWLVPGPLFTLDSPLGGVLAGASAMFLIGVADDLKPLPAKLKLVLQIGAAGLAYWLGVRIEFLSNPLGDGIWVLPTALSVGLTLFWLVGITNTINLIDGLDGLAGGVSLIAAGTMTLIALQTNQPTAALMTLALAGGIIGFLRYNFNPAKIFMGDSGSLFLGFTLAAISIMGVLKLVATVALALPLLILGVPIFDTAFAIVRRAWNHKPIFSPDRGHLHHRLLNAGLSQRKAVVVIYGFSLLLGGASLTLLGMSGGPTMIVVACLFIAWGGWGVLRSRLAARPPES